MGYTYKRRKDARKYHDYSDTKLTNTIKNIRNRHKLLNEVHRETGIPTSTNHKIRHLNPRKIARPRALGEPELKK